MPGIWPGSTHYKHAWHLWILDEFILVLDKTTTWKKWNVFEETQTYGSLIQIKLRVPSTPASEYFVKDSQQQSQPQQCKKSNLCQHFILPFLIFDILSGFYIPGSAASRPGNYFPYILGKAWKKIDGHLISYKYQFLGAAPHTARRWPLQHTTLDCLWPGTFSPIHKLISLPLSRKLMLGRIGIMKTQANKQAKDNNRSQNPSKNQNKALEQNQIIKSIWCGFKRAQMIGVTSHLEGGEVECFGSNEISHCAPPGNHSWAAWPCHPRKDAAMEQSLLHSPVNTHVYLQLWWHQKTWEPGLPYIPLLIAGRWFIFYFPGAQSRTVRYWAPTPRVQHHDSFRAKSVCCHPSQFNSELSVGDNFSLTVYKGKGWTTPPFTNLDVVQVFSFLLGIFPILKIHARN